MWTAFLTSLWPRIQGWGFMLLASLLVLAGAYAAGGRAARRSMKLNMAQRNLNMRTEARHVARNIDALDDMAVSRRARRWVRGTK